jgi:RNA recognition motif-containing protein
MANRDDGEGRKCFMGGLPFAADDGMIRDGFGKFGEIEDVYLPTDKESGKPRGFGFITFKDPRDARDASDEMHGCAAAERIKEPREL